MPDYQSREGLPVRSPAAPWREDSGAVLADHVKNLDWHARRLAFEAKAPADVVTDVRERLRVLETSETSYGSGLDEPQFRGTGGRRALGEGLRSVGVRLEADRHHLRDVRSVLLRVRQPLVEHRGRRRAQLGPRGAEVDPIAVVHHRRHRSRARPGLRRHRRQRRSLRKPAASPQNGTEAGDERFPRTGTERNP